MGELKNNRVSLCDVVGLYGATSLQRICNFVVKEIQELDPRLHHAVISYLYLLGLPLFVYLERLSHRLLKGHLTPK